MKQLHDEEATYQHVPFGLSGIRKVKYLRAEPLPPRKIAAMIDEPQSERPK